MGSITTDASFFFSEHFSCLDYDHESILSESEKDRIADRLDEILRRFLDTIEYIHTPPTKDANLRRAVWAWAEQELTEASLLDMPTLDPVLEEACSCAESFYPLASLEVRLSMAKGTALIITLDSHLVPQSVKGSLGHAHNLYMQGRDPQHPWFSLFLSFVHEAAELFGTCNPLVGVMLSSGWFRYVEGISQEETLVQSVENSTNTVSVPKTSPVEDFPYYFRAITGAQVPYFVAAFKPSRELEVPYPIWMSYAPAMTTLINLGNDLLSYPKELSDGERDTYLVLFTKTQRDAGCTSRFTDGLWTLRDSLYDVFQRVVTSVKALDRAFVHPRSDPELDEQLRLAAIMVNSFKQGYFAWHVNCDRYRLHALRAHLESQIEGSMRKVR